MKKDKQKSAEIAGLDENRQAMTEDSKKQTSKWRVGSAILFFVKDPRDNPKSLYHFYRIEDIGNNTDLITVHVPEGSESKCWDSHEIFDVGLDLGHTEDQIEAALILADWCKLRISIDDVARASNEEYESWLNHAKKRRSAGWRREVRKLKKLQLHGGSSSDN